MEDYLRLVWSINPHHRNHAKNFPLVPSRQSCAKVTTHSELMRLPLPAREIVATVRRHRLNYDTFRKACHQARKHLNLKPPKRGRQLPKLLPDATLKKYFDTILNSGDLKHEILFRLLFYTAIRVSELTHIQLSDVDLTAGKIYIESGKGDRDRYVLFPESFRSLLRAYMESCKAKDPDQEYLFESKQKRHYSEMRIRQIMYDYRDRAGIEERVHPHLLRHSMLTWLTRQGLSDAQIQLVSGHQSKKSLERYQHMALSDVKTDYEQAVKKLEI